MNNLCLEIGYNSLNKFGEKICGDQVSIVEKDASDFVMVLADGLGSGVKAGILSTLTSKIISTMIAQSMSIEECASTIAATLPVCSVRKIAYSTFTIIHIINNEEAEIIQYDNPHVILLRNGKSIHYAKTVMKIEEKDIYISRMRLQEHDIFVAMSDGVPHAGVGGIYNFGWQREDIAKYLEKIHTLGFTDAKIMTTMLLEECNKLYKEQPGDDATVCTMRIRKREPVNLLIGPSGSGQDITKMMSLFFSKPGKHIICGGTTSRLAAEFLGKELMTTSEFLDPDVPPIATIEGVDLVTEGVITMNKVLQYAQNYLDDNSMYIDWKFQDDGASRIARLLFEEATDINFYVGRAVNPAHQNSNMAISFTIKMNLVEQLSLCLEKMRKRIKVSYF